MILSDGICPDLTLFFRLWLGIIANRRQHFCDLTLETEEDIYMSGNKELLGVTYFICLYSKGTCVWY